MFQDVSIWRGWQSLCSFPCPSLLEMWGVWPRLKDICQRKQGLWRVHTHMLTQLSCAAIKRSCVMHSMTRVLGWTDQQYYTKINPNGGSVDFHDIFEGYLKSKATFMWKKLTTRPTMGRIYWTGQISVRPRSQKKHRWEWKVVERVIYWRHAHERNRWKCCQ